MALFDFVMRIVNRLTQSNKQLTQPKTCNGCKHLMYDTNGGHWCTLFAENCSDTHQPLDNRCYEGGRYECIEHNFGMNR